MDEAREKPVFGQVRWIEDMLNGHQRTLDEIAEKRGFAWDEENFTVPDTCIDEACEDCEVDAVCRALDAIEAISEAVGAFGVLCSKGDDGKWYCCMLEPDTEWRSSSAKDEKVYSMSDMHQLWESEASPTACFGFTHWLLVMEEKGEFVRVVRDAAKSRRRGYAICVSDIYARTVTVRAGSAKEALEYVSLLNDRGKIDTRSTWLKSQIELESQLDPDVEVDFDAGQEIEELGKTLPPGGDDGNREGSRRFGNLPFD